MSRGSDSYHLQFLWPHVCKMKGSFFSHEVTLQLNYTPATQYFHFLAGIYFHLRKQNRWYSNAGSQAHPKGTPTELLTEQVVQSPPVASDQFTNTQD